MHKYANACILNNFAAYFTLLNMHSENMHVGKANTFMLVRNISGVETYSSASNLLSTGVKNSDSLISSIGQCLGAYQLVFISNWQQLHERINRFVIP